MDTITSTDINVYFLLVFVAHDQILEFLRFTIYQGLLTLAVTTYPDVLQTCQPRLLTISVSLECVTLWSERFK